MRKEFFECGTLEEAESACPWAAECILVEGGYQCFESATDADIFRGQA